MNIYALEKIYDRESNIFLQYIKNAKSQRGIFKWGGEREVIKMSYEAKQLTLVR